MIIRKGIILILLAVLCVSQSGCALIQIPLQVAGTAIDLADKVLASFGEAQYAQLEINGSPRSVMAVGHKNNRGEVRLVSITVKMNA